MALMFNARAVDDGGARKSAAQEEERKKRQGEQGGQTPYEQRQAEIKAGVNTAKPISYTAPAKAAEPEEEEEQPRQTAGNMTIPTRDRTQDYIRAEEDVEEWNEKQAVAKQPAVSRQQTAATETATETAPGINEAQKPKTATASAPIVYTGGKTERKTVGTGTAAQTKKALTEEEEEPDWASMLPETDAHKQQAANTRARQAEREQLRKQEEAIAAMNAKPQYDPETIQRVRDQALAEIEARNNNENAQYLADNGLSWTGNPSMSADRTTTSGGETFMDPDIQEAYERSVQAWINYGLPKEEAEANAKRALADQMKTTVSELPKPVQRYGEIWAEAQAPTAPAQTTATTRTTTEPTIEDLAKQYGISQGTLQDPDFQKILQNMKAQGMTNSAALSNSYAQFQGTRQDEKRQLVYDLEEKYLDEAGLDYSDLGNAEADALHARAVKEAEEAFKEPTYRYTGEQRAEKQAPQFTWPTFGGKAANTSTTPTTGGTNNRPGAAAEVASWEQNQGWIQQNDKEGGVIDENAKPRPDKNGNATTNAAGNPITTGSAQTSTDKSSNPKGTQYLTPSYGQGGKVVKLPYKQGGYTEDELKKAGNNSWGTKYGSNVYEGYYKAPDGQYYPVDQEKAAYYKANGYSYDGWEEGMRDYYNTFGTFYGYRPDWRSAGKSGGCTYSPRSYGYSRSGVPGTSYGNGSTANNGVYWNGLSRWSL